VPSREKIPLDVLFIETSSCSPPSAHSKTILFSLNPLILPSKLKNPIKKLLPYFGKNCHVDKVPRNMTDALDDERHPRK
jgi:hypothetical protein